MAATKAVSPAVLRYATISARTTLGEGSEGVTVREDGARTHFDYAGAHYATLEFTATEQVVQARQPLELGELEARLRSSTSAPITRDPRPWARSWGKRRGKRW
jgi:hypothetical protein